MAKIKYSAIAKGILAVAGVAGIITIAAIAPNSLQMLKLFGFGKKDYNPKSVYNTLKRLQKNKLVDITEKDGKIIIKITKDGKNKILEYGFENMQITKPKKWDGKWRIIGFDIPEKKKKAREALRHKIKELGFIKMQKSLFVYPYECKEEVEFVGEFFQVYEHIVLIEASSINQEEHYKHIFELA